MSALPPWRARLLELYYYGSYPWRYFCNARHRRRGRMPIPVLFYHRVADDDATPWTCPTGVFRRQVRWLSDHLKMLSLAEVQERIAAGRNDEPAACVTFDDGYAENCRDALPLLLEHRIPCTYFVTLRNIVDGVPFPHDQRLGLNLRPNTPDELRRLSRAGIEIGGHTRTHADLGAIVDPAVLHDEVLQANDELAALVGAPIRYFAFPYGQKRNLNPAVFDMLRRAGVRGVCTAYGGYNVPGRDPFQIQRVHVDDDLISLRNRASIDPRYQWLEPYDDRHAAAVTSPRAPDLIEVPGP